MRQPGASFPCIVVVTYLLRTALVHNIGAVLRLLAVLPVQEHDELTGGLIFTGVDRFDMVLPGSRGGLPRHSLGHGCWRRRLGGVAVALRLFAGRLGGRRGPRRFPAALLRLDSFVGLFKNSREAPSCREIFFEKLSRSFSVSTKSAPILLHRVLAPHGWRPRRIRT